MKIFGIGLSKTGTKSLTEALKMLNFSSVHFDISETTYQDLTEGNYSLRIMQKFDAYVDGIAPFYPQLDVAFPKSKFILTIRDEQSWLESVRCHLIHILSDEFEENRKKGKPFHKMMLFYHAAAYGSVFYSRERYLYSYEKHTKNTLDYFKNKNNLLVLNICEGDKWEKLCEFLEVPVPNLEFPHFNKTENHHALIKQI